MQLLASTINIVGLFTQLQIVMLVPIVLSTIATYFLGCLSCVFAHVN